MEDLRPRPARRADAAAITPDGARAVGSAAFAGAGPSAAPLRPTRSSPTLPSPTLSSLTLPSLTLPSALLSRGASFVARGRGSAAPAGARVAVAGVLAAVAVVGSVITAGGPFAARGADAAGLPAACAAIVERAAEFDGRVGAVVLDLQSGEQCTVGPREQFVTASLYKVVVLAELMRQIDAGTVAWDDPVVVDADMQEDTPAGDRATYTTTVRAAAEQMIQVSANDAAHALRRLLGRDLVAAAPGWLGMPDTSLGEEFTTDADDIARLFSLIYHGQVVSPEASAEMFDLLAGQRVRNRLPRELPTEATLAHKTGDLEGSAHDAGIVTGPGGSFVIAVLTEVDGGSTVDDGYDTIAELGALAYETVAEPRAALAAAPTRAGEPLVMAPGQEPARAPAAATAGASPIVDAAGTGSAGTDSAGTGSAGIGAAGAGPVEERGGLGRVAAVGGGAGIALLAAAAGLWGMRTFWRGRRAAPHPVPAAVRAAVRPLAAPVRAAAPAVAFADDRGDGDGRTFIPISGGAGVEHEAPAPAATAPHAAARARSGEDTMRFGARIGRDDEPRRGEEEFSAVEEAASVLGGGAAGAEYSERLRRLATYFDAQGDLLREMSAQVREETEPLGALLAQQRETMRAVLRNLEARLRPLQEYAQGEEANLAALEQQMTAGGMDFVARSFAEYLDEQRRRISSTRTQIGEQRRPFEQYGEQQQEAVEVALSRFDDDLLALEANLAEQRKVMMRMLDAMRSDSFVGARDFLAEREQAVRRAAEEGVTDPGELAGRLRPLRERVSLGDSEYAQRLLAITDAADRELLDVARQAGPVPVPPPPAAVREAAAERGGDVDVDDDGDEAAEQTA